MIDYTVSILDADAHLIDVVMEMKSPDPAGQVLRLPDWIPGSYMIRDFSRNIVQISAFSGHDTVQLTKTGKSVWQAAPGPEQLKVHYRVYAWDLSVRAAHVDRTHAFFNGTSIFLAACGLEDQPHRICFERPLHDVDRHFQLATSLPQLETDIDGFGWYRTDDYDELLDHPVEQGTFKRLEFDVCGIPHEIVFTGACHFDETRLLGDLKRICKYEIEFFGRPAPVDRYVFLVMVVDSGYGGLEHRASTALMITRDSLPIIGQTTVTEPYLNFLGLCSHEYFHTWNVKRIKPARFVPYDLSKESCTELLWFFEGMTSYYDDLVLARSGLIDETRYMNVLAKTLTRVQRGPGRLIQTVTDSSLDAWHKFYKQDENAPNAIVSYYAKGALIALCLDSLMRRISGGARSLDDLMRLLWQRWQENQQGVGENEPQQLASELVDSDLSEFFELALYTTQELPLSEALEYMGIQLCWRPRTGASDTGGVRIPSLENAKRENGSSNSDVAETSDQNGVGPWLGATLTDAPGGTRVVQVLSGSPAEKAGLAGGDLLIAINHLSIRNDDVEALLNRHADLPNLDIHYFRLGQLYQSKLPVEPAPMDTAELQILDKSRVRAWLFDARSSS